jgi:hypothetical protein
LKAVKLLKIYCHSYAHNLYISELQKRHSYMQLKSYCME